MADRFDELAQRLYPYEGRPTSTDKCLACDSRGMCDAHVCEARIAAALRDTDRDARRQERDRYREALSYAESNLTCAGEGAEHGGMWCFTRAALNSTSGGECGCANCTTWRAVCGLIDAREAADG